MNLFPAKMSFSFLLKKFNLEKSLNGILGDPGRAWFAAKKKRYFLGEMSPELIVLCFLSVSVSFSMNIGSNDTLVHNLIKVRWK